MNLSDYFENVKGTGILATADGSGKVNAAIYARPHFIDENTLAFIMTEKLTHANLQANPNAAYLFIEDKPGYSGRRLYLKKTKEEQNAGLVKEMRRSSSHSHGDDDRRYVVYFTVESVLPLIGE